MDGTPSVAGLRRTCFHKTSGCVAHSSCFVLRGGAICTASSRPSICNSRGLSCNSGYITAGVHAAPVPFVVRMFLAVSVDNYVHAWVDTLNQSA